ncbi:hypothetical protein AB0M44_32285 [Streptosporangium subroseum]|uniref:trypsin-like serine peptidase n=1 Tax=Streptosporangium subroseum TaxID=106412 RepID=UPI00342866C4
MNTSLKRTLLPLGGGLAAAALLGASMTGTAQATDIVKHSESVGTPDAQGIATFWLRNNAAALEAATYLEEDTTEVSKLTSTGTAEADTKPGSVAPTTTTTTTTSKNINLPRTIGKVFFVNAAGENKWCSATSLQSKYQNVVATAGHCTYDTANDEQLLDKWIFVPGYYQGKAPWGIYVGKQAFVHYDFGVYEDYDRDYAFVTVYNGVSVSTDTTSKKNKRISDITVTDAGRLGDNVGGQGFAWNQKLQQANFVFGYPQAAQPDGNKPFTGATPKWCYGKTTAKTVGDAAKKIEEHVGIKCSMTAGADGGPWLLKYSNTKRLGYLNGVTSTFNDQDENNRVDYLSTPYFDGDTYNVYTSAANLWSGTLL